MTGWRLCCPAVHLALGAHKGIAPAHRRGNKWEAAIREVNSISIICVRLDLLPTIAEKSLAAVGWEMIPDSGPCRTDRVEFIYDPDALSNEMGG